jgi:catalase
VAVTPQQATEAANDAYGRHPGYRALHAKGTLLKGTFTATAEAAALSRAPHLQGDPVPATVRFSNGSGNPRSPDYAPDVRGLAVKLYLPDGSRTDIVAQTSPRFPVHTPEGFLELLRASTPSPHAAWRMPLFLLRHPEAIPCLPANLGALAPPASYATCRYYATHAYRFLDAQGGSRYVRYTLDPEAGQAKLGPRQARRGGRE